MALIKSGDFGDLSLAPKTGAPAELQPIDSFSMLAEAARELPVEDVGFAKSPQPRGLALKRLHMGPGFQSFVKRLFHMSSKVYFLAWGWDLSGEKVQGDSPVFLYPGTVSPDDSTLIPMKGDQEREFLGEGVLLYPARRITAGLSLRLQIWESQSDMRRFGDTLQKVSDSIGKSELNNVLAGIAALAGVTTATLALAEKAGLELASVIGGILKTTSDDYVDYYEGYFPASTAWEPKEQSWAGADSEIVLSRFE
ncbi:MAG: hypothetical protein WA687_05035 [Solirubrobacterales bacterium]